MTKSIKLDSLNIYPVKSLGGINLLQSKAEMRGLKYDRRFMLVDDQGRFLSQREHARLTLLGTRIEGDRLIIFEKNSPLNQNSTSLIPNSGNTINVKIWNDTAEALLASEATNLWISEFLQSNARLVYMPDTSTRQVDPERVAEKIDVGFADAYPYLLINRASVDQVSDKAGEKIPLDRFRGNLVVSGAEAFAEDRWERIRIGKTIFRLVKPCARCVVTTIDQHTAKKGKQPLKSLAEFRKQGNKILFGINLICEQYGKIEVGAEVEVLSSH
ncbi:MAG: MOSC domain-containing protein [Cyclobacteriaceae bacterium]